jgi:hypothetical protein
MKNNIIPLDVSKSYILHVDKLIERNKLEILEWFEENISDFKVNVYIYKDNNSLREGLKRRGHGLYPAHMVACMIDEDLNNNIRRSINIYEPSINTNEVEYSKKEYDVVIYHELIHYITNILYGKLPEWLTEGIAKYLDGSYSQDLTNLIKIIEEYEIPDISTMNGGFFVYKTYIQEENELKEKTIYNGYDLSYIMIRYIIEIYGKEYLKELLKNKEEINKIEQTILIEASEYYKSLYLKENTIKNKKI